MFTRVFSLLILAAIGYAMGTTVTGCANIVPPVGGPRDSIAPKLLKVNPENKSLQVKDKSIVFNFDEYVELDNASSKIVISPLPNIPPEITRKLKTVTIRLKDSLEPNTTYTIAINGAIKDVNEGNALLDLNYAFSTGDFIDSNSISGKVILAETGKIDTTLIVVLHPEFLDSAVYKNRPKYVSTLDSKGQFQFKNLPAKQFAIYTFSDEGNQKKYLNKTQLFGFHTATADAAKNESDLELFAYAQEKELPKTNTDRVSNPNEKVRINANLSGNQQDILKDLVLTFNKKFKEIDLSQLILTDTNYNVKKSTTKLDTAKNSITVQTEWQPDTYYRFLLPNTFFKDDKGNFLPKSDTLRFKTKSNKDYGKVILRFNQLDLAKNPVLQIVLNDGILSSYPLTSFKLNIPLISPGEYELRLLMDENKNGKWDPGSFFGIKKQPEKVLVLPKKLTVKADWDNELEID